MTTTVDPTTLSTEVLRGLRAGLSVLDGTDDAERLDLIGELEALKAAACAAQARLALDLETSQRELQRAAGVPEADLGRGVASQVGLARRESPAKARRLLGLAHAMTELPCTFAALAAGETSEWRAMLVARETAWLTREDRQRVDAELAHRPGGIGSLGDRGIEAETRRIAYRLDPAGAVRRCARAVDERRVSLRPAPDAMTHLSALLPVREGVAVYAALSREADALRAQGDPRSRGQVMADALVTRVTGQAAADQVPLEVHLVMTDTALLGAAATGGAATGGAASRATPDAAQQPALLHGHGLAPVEVPAPLARSWARDTEAGVWLRRLYTSPADGSLVAMDARRRVFTGLQRRLVVLRDQTCRTPWCDAPVRHVDHVRRAADGGPTDLANAQGLCVACNQAREAPGWRARVVPRRPGAVETTLPTGHRYATRPPPVLATARAGPSPVEGLVVDLVWGPAA